MMQEQRFRENWNFRRAELQFSVMADDHVFHKRSQLGRKSGKPVARAAHDPETDDDMPQQLSFCAVPETARIRELFHFADIVKNRARNQQVEINVL